MKYRILFLIMLLGWTEAQAGGPWTKKKGEGYAQFAFYLIPPINRLSISPYRTQFLNRAVFDATAELYAEYGVLDKLTLSATLPLKIVSTGNKVIPTDSAMLVGGSLGPSSEVLDAGLLVDLGNITFGGKYNFFSKKISLAAHFLLSAPTAIQAYNPRTALRSAYPCWGFQPSLSIGYNDNKIYTYFEAGMNFRTHDYSHQIVANFEFGWKVAKKQKHPVPLSLTLNTIIALPGGDDVPNSNEAVQTGLYINNQNFVGITFKCMIPVSDYIGINLSLGGGLWANNVQQGPSIGLGVYYKWKKKQPSKKI